MILRPNVKLSYLEFSREADLEEQPQWFIGEEVNVTYTLESGAGLYLYAWDWIGLYKV